MSDFLNFTLRNSADESKPYRFRYSSMNLMRHSSLFRKHILAGRTTFTLHDLKTHKYVQHEAEVFKEVVHWLAENCRAAQLAWAVKRLERNIEGGELVWRGWKDQCGRGVCGFERVTPWAPLDCIKQYKIGKVNGLSYVKGLWMYAYMLQLDLDHLLKPAMMGLRDHLKAWKITKAEEMQLLWCLFGKDDIDAELFRAGIVSFLGGGHSKPTDVVSDVLGLESPAGQGKRQGEIMRAKIEPKRH